MGPLVLALILGPMAESNLRRALALSEGSFATFVMRPISLLFLVLGWLEVHGAFAVLIITVLVVEVVITLMDFPPSPSESSDGMNCPP